MSRIWFQQVVCRGNSLTWLGAWGHFARIRAVERAGLESRVLAAEAVQDELRKQLSGGELELSELRAALDVERVARAQAETRLGDRERLADRFTAVSGEALRANSEAFLRLAREAVTPLEDTLRRYETGLRELERAREQAYGGLKHELESLSRETGSLATALRTPQVRGRWGELTLHRVVELAGMSAHCDFVEQASLASEGGRRRPDMIVRLPAGRQIVVDAKVPLAAYLEAMEAGAEPERRAALERHAAQLRSHMNQLAGKAYWVDLDLTPELVVMFIPGEPFFAAAVDADRTLIEDGVAKGVVLATPTTLIALLRPPPGPRLPLPGGRREDRQGGRRLQPGPRVAGGARPAGGPTLQGARRRDGGGDPAPGARGSRAAPAQRDRRAAAARRRGHRPGDVIAAGVIL